MFLYWVVARTARSARYHKISLLIEIHRFHLHIVDVVITSISRGVFMTVIPLTIVSLHQRKLFQESHDALLSRVLKGVFDR